MMRRAFLAVLFCSLCAGLAIAKPAKKGDSGDKGRQKPAMLKADTPTRGVLDLAGQSMALYRVEVPDDAILMTVEILDCPLILDLLAKLDEPPTGPSDAEHRSSPDVLDSALRVSRQSLPPLESGMWYLGVTYLDNAPAVVHRRPVKEVSYSVKVSFVRAKIAGTLEPCNKVRGQIRAEEGSVCSFAIDVPQGAKALRFDLDEVSSNLDLLARPGKPLISNDDADDVAISPLGRESLLIDADSPTPLTPGRWYVNVVHPAGIGTVDFSLYATFDTAPCKELLAIPALVHPSDPRQRAVRAAVDVTTELAGASGTLLTPDGLVLTNYHVIAEVAENAAEKDPVVIGVTLDPRDQPRELYRGRVIHFDKRLDLALIQITGGLYGQPLPSGYRFPFIPLGDSSKLEVGDRVAVIGFPSIAGTTGRVSVTMTQGVLSGFEKLPIGTILKTDAAISPGNSGGAALDAEWRLIGVPTFENVSVEEVSRMSYVHPIEMLPAEWRKMIEQRTSGEKQADASP